MTTAVLPDAVGGGALVGTDRGVVTLYPPATGARRGAVVATGAGAARAGAAARSPLDGSAWLSRLSSALGETDSCPLA